MSWWTDALEAAGRVLARATSAKAGRLGALVDVCTAKSARL
jgi:hypothetical protein